MIIMWAHIHVCIRRIVCRSILISFELYDSIVIRGRRVVFLFSLGSTSRLHEGINKNLTSILSKYQLYLFGHHNTSTIVLNRFVYEIVEERFSLCSFLRDVAYSRNYGNQSVISTLKTGLTEHGSPDKVVA